MNTGRIAAQASHASNAFIHAARRLPSNNKFLNDIQKWMESTNQGFGTVLVLVASGNELNNTISNARSSDFVSEIVEDPTFGYTVNREISRLIPHEHDTADRQELDKGQIRLFRNEITCGYIFGTKEELKLICGHLPLHP